MDGALRAMRRPAQGRAPPGAAMVTPVPPIPPAAPVAPPPEPPRAWSPQAWEARLLARSLRAVPVTLLHGSDAADRRALIAHGLLPLLARRDDDRAASAPAPGAPPRPDGTEGTHGTDAPDRRRRIGRGAEPAEQVVALHDWPLPPTPLVPLAQRLREAGATPGPPGRGDPPRRALLLLVGCDAALAAAAGALHPDPFWLALVQALLQQPRQVHVLLAVDDATAPGLCWLGAQLPGLGDQALKLDRLPLGRDPHLAAVPGLAARRGAAPTAASTAPTAPPAPPDEWLDGLRQALHRVATQGRSGAPPVEAPPRHARPPAVPAAPAPPAPAPAPAPIPPPAPAMPPPARHPEPRPAADVDIDLDTVPEPRAEPIFEPAPAAPPLDFVPEREAPVRAAFATAPPPPRRPGPWAGVALGLALGVAFVVGVGLWLQPRPAGAPQAPPDAALQAQPPGAGPRPAPAAAEVEPGQALQAALAGLAVQDLRGDQGDRDAALAALARAPQPGLALMRQDLLQALPWSGAAGGLRVVAPLFAEPLQAWVRADAPAGWRLLREGRIDTGPRGGDALGAARLLRSVTGLGSTAAARRLRHLPDAQALAALQRGEVDVVLRVGASPLDAPARAAQAAGTLRPLALEDADARTRAALRRHPAVPLPGTADRHAPGVLTFLVAHGPQRTAREQLAARALQALCAAHPAWRAAVGPQWRVVAPDDPQPAARPYAAAAGPGCAGGPTAAAGAAREPARPR